MVSLRPALGLLKEGTSKIDIYKNIMRQRDFSRQIESFERGGEI
jgi:hypothetical protein